jgi:hypothetical protein
MLSSWNVCLMVAKICVAFFPWFAQTLMNISCRIHREIASDQIDSNWKNINMNTSIQLRYFVRLPR